ncbi:MAG: ankyrin repeat domain-containing protein [Alphaproteobacteria bacterium]
MGIFSNMEDRARLLLSGMADMVAPATKDEWDERLRVAVQQGTPGMAKRAIDNGANVQQTIQDGARKAPLLTIAAERGFADIAALLVEKGANVNAKDTFGDTAIVKAVENDWPKVVAVLAAKGAAVNTINANGQSLMDRAIATYAHDTAGILGKHGGKLSSQLNAAASKQQPLFPAIPAPVAAQTAKP